MIRISAVSYLNTYPFIYGLERSELINECNITTDVPAICAQKLLNNEVDIGLVPVAIIPQLNSYRIISDYCIGAIGKVHTVLLLSKIPLPEIKNIYLDNESFSSVGLSIISFSKFFVISIFPCFIYYIS
jgi:chorismate dehydratase